MCDACSRKRGIYTEISLYSNLGHLQVYRYVIKNLGLFTLFSIKQDKARVRLFKILNITHRLDVPVCRQCQA